jgi:hypothetical protein
VTRRKEALAVPKARSGKRSAKFRVQIVEEGGQIRLFFDEYDQPPITFNRRTGASGPRAYSKLSKVLDAAERRESQTM